MANILAGQRAAFTKALQGYNATEDEQTKLLQAGKMARIIERAPSKGLTRNDVTQGRALPDIAEKMLAGEDPNPVSIAEPEPDPDTQVAELNRSVDTSDVREVGDGPQAVYAYGYNCAPDRLKVGRTESDVIGRIASQINTSTPDRPALRLLIRTRNCAALERAIHAVLQYRGRAISGGGTEWFLTSTEEVWRIYREIVGQSE